MFFSFSVLRSTDAGVGSVAHPPFGVAVMLEKAAKTEGVP